MKPSVHCTASQVREESVAVSNSVPQNGDSEGRVEQTVDDLTQVKDRTYDMLNFSSSRTTTQKNRVSFAVLGRFGGLFGCEQPRVFAT